MKTIATRYARSDRAAKALVLDELWATTGLHRDHARKAQRRALVLRVARPRAAPAAAVWVAGDRGSAFLLGCSGDLVRAASRGVPSGSGAASASDSYCGFTEEKHGHMEGYLPSSNQAICYAHGCIDKRLNSRKDIHFVWLGQGKSDVDELGLWVRKGFYLGDDKDPWLRRGIPA